MRAAVLILRDFANVLKLYNADVVKVVATSAVREAGNSDAFLDRILMATGFDVDIISSSDESRLTVAAVRQEVGRKQLAKQNSVIVEVGGGNTEINVLRKGQIAASRNLAIGSIRMQEILYTSYQVSGPGIGYDTPAGGRSRIIDEGAVASGPGAGFLCGRRGRKVGRRKGRQENKNRQFAVRFKKRPR